MRVSSKIIAGFLALMLLAIIVVANQLMAIRQMQAVNHDLSEIDFSKSAITVLDMQRLADLLGDDSKKYFATLDSLYERHTTRLRDEFIEDLGKLRQSASSEREQAQLAKVQEPFDDLWPEFNTLKQQNKSFDELPPDLAVAVMHLQTETEVMLEAVQLAIKERVAAAAEVGEKAERLSWIVGVFALFLGVVVA